LFSFQKFDVDVFAESATKQPVKDIIRSKLVPQLRREFQKLGPALIAEHGKDIQHAAGADPSKAFTPARVHPQQAAASKQADNTSTKSKTGGVVNTTTVTDNEEFRTTADEMYQTFVDPARLAAFTRSPPKVFEGAKPGGKFELFGGNVSGEYLELEQPKKVVQSWRLREWPEGHFSTLRIEFDQNDVDHVTVMRVVWEGVPVGQEDVTKRNWTEYYIKSIKQTFGFGTIL
jgi:activator of HSP90 ATPase